MAYFAEIKNNIVQRVVVADSAQWCIDNFGGTWIQTLPTDSVKNYAGVGHTYDGVKDNFVGHKTFASWVLDANCKWQPPIARPADQSLVWNEKLQSFTSSTLARVDNNSLIL